MILPAAAVVSRFSDLDDGKPVRGTVPGGRVSAVAASVAPMTAAASDESIRPSEIAVPLPDHTDAGVYFIGRIRTPWLTRRDCPRRGALDGPVCTIEVDERWLEALTGIEMHPRIQVLYWMHEARRDLVLQRPGSTGLTYATFALRSPVRPNPIASSVVALVERSGVVLKVRGLDCLDGTPLIDLKPERGVAEHT
ncbi:MAG: SAM-dependent methyltransferase [Acetobacteraceae bacterium]|jgi:tRNA-Thr(GGU) m(6)t(6)A37 methyltransferase TsaA